MCAGAGRSLSWHDIVRGLERVRAQGPKGKKEPSAVLVELHTVAHGASCECDPQTQVAGGLLRWQNFFNQRVLKKITALRFQRSRGKGLAAEAALDMEPCGFDFLEMRAGQAQAQGQAVTDCQTVLSGALHVQPGAGLAQAGAALVDEDCVFLNENSDLDGDAPTGQPAGPPPTPAAAPPPAPASQRPSRAKTPGVGSNPHMLYGDDMDTHLDRADTADLQRRELLELQQRQQDTQTQMEEMSAQMEARGVVHAATVVAHATELAAQVAAHQRALAAQQGHKQATQLAFERERERVGEERGLRADAEEGLKREKERSSAALKAAERSTTAALRAQDTEQRSNNERTREKAAQATGLEAALAQLQRKLTSTRDALEIERAKRKKAVDAAIREQDLAVEAQRANDDDLRSNNQRMLKECADSKRAVASLEKALARARQGRSVQEKEAQEAELVAAKRVAMLAELRIATLNKTTATLRASVAKSGGSQAAAAARAGQQRVRDLEDKVERHEKHLAQLALDEDAAEQADSREQKKQNKTHQQALRRGRVTRTELSQTKLQIGELQKSMAREVAAALDVRSAMDARHDDLMARLEAGASRDTQLLTELRSAGALARAEAKQAAMRHTQTLTELAGSRAALEAYRSFQAKEGGRYKASVRMCYYKLIDMKVPTNQIEEVVAAVLGMVGTTASALPKRSIAQNMRREMEHWADTVAGRELAAAHNVCGASDDTTKRQRTLAADVTHHLLPG